MWNNSRDAALGIQFKAVPPKEMDEKRRISRTASMIIKSGGEYRTYSNESEKARLVFRFVQEVLCNGMKEAESSDPPWYRDRPERVQWYHSVLRATVIVIGKGARPLASSILEIADQFFLLRINTDRRAALLLEPASLTADVTELSVPVGMRGAGESLHVDSPRKPHIPYILKTQKLNLHSR